MTDLIVIGGGPAGLSAALTASSEGLATILLDANEQFGGQAGTSTLIENYAGFREGITGTDLAAAMVDQAGKFGVNLIAPARACRLSRSDDGILTVEDDAGQQYQARAVLLAFGVQYRRLEAEGVSTYLGRGVSYGSPSLAANFTDKHLYIVGGANSAGQAAMYLSRCQGCTVHLIVRAKSLGEKMSAYLVDRIAATPNVQVHLDSEVQYVRGEDSITCIGMREGTCLKTMSADHLFVLIGAMPKTAWLDGIVQRDKHGFVFSGAAGDFWWPQHMTTMQGVFVAGDIRSDSVKRCASAVGDGAAAVADIHKYLMERQ